MLVITARSGSAQRLNSVISPGPRMAISTTMAATVPSAARMVRGTPTALFSLSWLA